MVASSLYDRRGDPAANLVITTTTSDPAVAVLPPITAVKPKPASAASFSSFSMVEVFVVANTRYS